MKARSEALPTAIYKNGKWELGAPYDYNSRAVCSVYGEMQDGTKVWVDEFGKQFTRQKIFGKYYFCEM